MPTPPLPWAVRALPRPRLRRLRHLLALTAVALPLVASVAAPAGVPAAGPSLDVPERVTVAPVPARVGLDVQLRVVAPGPVEPDPVEPSVGAVWDALADCESGGRWDAERSIDGVVAYRGGLQFAGSTWDAFRPDGFPDLASDATRIQQIVVAERILDVQGWEAWPACSRRLGLR